MPQLIQSGTFAIMNGSGVRDTPLPTQVTIQGVYINGDIFHAISSPQTKPIIIATALPNNATATIIGANPFTLWLVQMLIISISAAGSFDILDDTDVIFRTAALNTSPYQISIPYPGLLSQGLNRPLDIKNTSGSARDFSISYAYNQFAT